MLDKNLPHQAQLMDLSLTTVVAADRTCPEDSFKPTTERQRVVVPGSATHDAGQHAVEGDSPLMNTIKSLLNGPGEEVPEY